MAAPPAAPGPQGLNVFATSFADKLSQRQRTSRGLAPMGFGRFCREVLNLQHSPVMAAIVAASEGAPVTLDEETSQRLYRRSVDQLCVDVFGCPRDGLPRTAPRTVGIRAGGRAGKSSRLLAPKALHAAWTVPLPNLRKGEYARALITAPDVDFAKQVVNYCRGMVEDSPMLRSRVIGYKGDGKDDDDDQEIGTVECIKLRRPDGHLVEIALKAASGKGKTGRSRTLVFAGFDEACFFNSDTAGGKSYVVDEEELFGAVIQRVEPGGQVWLVSSPWVENHGYLEGLIAREFGKHETALVAVAGTRLLNPSWDPDGVIERDMRKTNPEKAMREIDAIPMASGAKQFFPMDAVARAFGRNRSRELQPLPGETHCAGVDFGFRKNSSALTIAREENGISRVAYQMELRPANKASLMPSEVVREFAFWCMRYGARMMRGDLSYVQTAHEELGKLARALLAPEQADAATREWVERVKRDPFACRSPVPSYQEWSKKPVETAEMYTEFRRRMQEGQAELLYDPDLGPRLREQLTQTTYYPGTGGIIKIVLPKIGWSHGDLLETTAIAVTMVELTAPDRVRRPTAAVETLGDWGTTDRAVIPRGYRGASRGSYGDDRGFG